jgi:hypothetical protein
VRLLRLPGDHRALVDEQTAELGVRMGELKRLNGPARPDLSAPVPSARGHLSTPVRSADGQHNGESHDSAFTAFMTGPGDERQQAHTGRDTSRAG